MVLNNIQSPPNPIRLIFLYGTRAGLWAGMAQDIYAEESGFREIILRCSRVIQQHFDWSLEKEFMQPPERYHLHEFEEYQQPVLTAMQIGLTEVWRTRGVSPEAVMGICGGEFAAGYAAGVLSLEHAMEFACRCTHCLQQKPRGGRMIMIDASVEEAQALQHLAPKPLFVASEFQRNITTIACALENLEIIIAFLQKKNVRPRLVKSNYASHCPFIAGCKKIFLRPLAGFRPTFSRIPVYSPIRGGLLKNTTFDMQYWWHVIRQPIIHQSDAYRSLILDGYNLVLEISADQVYSEEFPDIAAALGKEVEALPSMRKNRGTQSVMAKSLQLLQESGYSLRLTSYNGKS